MQHYYIEAARAGEHGRGFAVCLGQSINFIEGTTFKDLKEILATSDQYGKDADSM